jgi:starvation-inducible outer membrane lipoprotein
MKKFKFINYFLMFAAVVLGGCATKPSALEEQLQQKEALRKQQDAEIQQKIEELTATLDGQSEKLKAVETLVEAKPKT